MAVRSGRESALKFYATGTFPSSGPRDGKAGAAYVDVVSVSGSVHHATAFLSYAWSYMFREVVATLVDWCAAHSQSPEVFGHVTWA